MSRDPDVDQYDRAVPGRAAVVGPVAQWLSGDGRHRARSLVVDGVLVGRTPW